MSRSYLFRPGPGPHLSCAHNPPHQLGQRPARLVCMPVWRPRSTRPLIAFRLLHLMRLERRPSCMASCYLLPPARQGVCCICCSLPSAPIVCVPVPPRVRVRSVSLFPFPLFFLVARRCARAWFVAGQPMHPASAPIPPLSFRFPLLFFSPQLVTSHGARLARPRLFPLGIFLVGPRAVCCVPFSAPRWVLRPGPVFAREGGGCAFLFWGSHF